MQRFPEGLTVANGRFRLTSLVRGVPPDGLWQSSDRESGSDVWVTIRRVRPTPERVKLMTFSAYGIRPPLYVGPPDAYTSDDEYGPREYFVIVDEIPIGLSLVEVGRIDAREATELGIDLCNVITDWAAARDGHVLRGLRPETVFMSGAAGARRFTAATPRPYFMLGNEAPYGGYPYPSFDPPSMDSQPSPHDALFTLALIVWYAVTGNHPYDIPQTNMDRNLWEDKRLSFDGPEALGHVLESALVADPASRISIDGFRAALEALLLSRE